MKTFIILLCNLLSFHCYSQQFIALEPTNAEYQFPFFIDAAQPKVAEKINASLQINHLLKLPQQHTENPYTIVTDKNFVEKTYEYQYWESNSKHDSLISVTLKGTKNNEAPFTTQLFYDTRTGNSFQIKELFNKKGQKQLLKKVSVTTNNQVLITDTFTILKDNKTIQQFSLDELKPYLSEYGFNLLFEETPTQKEDLNGLFLLGTGENFSGNPMEYFVYIAKVHKNGEAEVYYWNRKRNSLNYYSDSTIKNGVVQADDYLFDRLSKQKVHNMYSLHLELQKDNSWIGQLQLGSPVYTLTFKEY